MEQGKQRLGAKKLKICSLATGRPIVAAFCNGTLPHGIAMAFVSPREAYLVNIKKRKAWPYIVEGKFHLKRARSVLAEMKLYDKQTYVNVIPPECDTQGSVEELDVTFIPEGRIFDYT